MSLSSMSHEAQIGPGPVKMANQPFTNWPKLEPIWARLELYFPPSIHFH